MNTPWICQSSQIHANISLVNETATVKCQQMYGGIWQVVTLQELCIILSGVETVGCKDMDKVLLSSPADWPLM